MKRNAMKKLISWKTEGEMTRPLLLCGLKGTGKTSLALDFAVNNYSQYLYVNFELDSQASVYFRDKILAGFSVIDTTAEFYQLEKEFLYSNLVIFDEVTFCPSLFHALEHSEAFPIILISGQKPLPEMTHSFYIVNLFPLTFDEFLCALGNEWYVDIIKGHYETRKPVPDIVHQELCSLFEEYLIVGGFPAAINEYITSKSVNNIGETHLSLLCRFRSDLCETYPKEASRICQLMKVMPDQLKRENKIFRYNSIRKGVTCQMYQDALFSLNQYGAVLPLYTQKRDELKVKLYFPDVGLLHTQLLCEESSEITKALIENYIMQTLTAGEKYQISFWESEASAKIEFLLMKHGVTTPVELHMTSKGKAKNIASYRNGLSKEEAESMKSCRFCYDNFYSEENYLQLPFYSIFCL